MTRLEVELLDAIDDCSLRNIKHGFFLEKSPEDFNLELIKDLPLESIPNQMKSMQTLMISQYSLYKLTLAGKLVEIIPVVKISNLNKYIYIIVDKKLSAHMEEYLTFDNLKQEKDEYEIKKEGIISSGEMIYLYVLSLNHNYKYVGITKDVQLALKDHEKGFHEWTKKHKILKIDYSRSLNTNIYEEARKKEDLETQKLMKEYGVEKVRGGKYEGLCDKDVFSLLPKKMKKKGASSLI